jgi:tetratricopeptide (TPR) repeat protein
MASGWRAPALARAEARGRRAARAMLLVACFALACGASDGDRLAEARRLREAGRESEAIAILYDLAERNPNDRDVSLELGLALVRAGQINLAIVYLQKAESAPELAAQAAVELARIFVETQNYEEAIRALTRALAREPDNFEALLLRAGAAIEIGHHAEALADADRMLADDPEQPGPRRVKAAALTKLGRLADAEREFAKLKELAAKSGEAADSAEACVAYADFQAEGRKDLARAEREFDRCAELYATHRTVLSSTLKFYDAHDRRDKAIALLERVAKETPDDLSVRKALADRLAESGDAAAGEATLREVADRLDSQAPWTLLADYLRAQNRPADALVAIERAIGLTAEGVEPLVIAQIDLCLDLGRVEAAEAATARIELPVFRDIAQGRILLAKGDPKGALAALERGLRTWPNNGWARFHAGKAAMALGDSDRALTEFVEATRSEPERTDAALAAAELYLARGDFDRAAEMADRHEAHRAGGKVNALLLGARAEEASGRHETARAIVDSAVERFPKDPYALAFRASFVRAEKGPARAARELAASGLDFTDPANEPAIRALADLRAAEGKPETALALADAGIAAHPDAAFFHELRGRVLVLLGRTAEAKAAIERALEIAPDDDAALAALGSLVARGGDPARGLELLDRAAALAPDEPDHAFQAALLVLSQGREDDAIARLRAALARNPTHVATCNQLAWMLAARKQELPLAVELATRAARLEPTAEVLDTLGYVLLANGDAPAAVAALDRSLALRPNAPGSRYRLGLALAASGQPREAERALREALADGAFAESDDARARLAELERSRATP